MTHVLDLTDRKYKVIVINMLMVLLEKVDRMQNQMGDVNRKVKTIIKN